MKKILLISILCLSACFYSCEDNDDLQSRLKDIEGRLPALNHAVEEINQNIKSLHKLHQIKDEGTAITAISTTDVGYLIKLEDGSDLPLVVDSQLKATVPLVGIDSEDFWVVSISGATILHIKDVDGENLSTDGSNVDLLPQLKLDAKGCWMISYDEGGNWDYMGDRLGNKIDALVDNVTTSSSSFIKEVEFDDIDNILRLTLLTGEVFTLTEYKEPAPIATIINSEVSKPTVSTLSFNVTIQNATEWKYIYKKASETAPSVEDVVNNGTMGVGTNALLQDLESLTAYKIYVVAIQSEGIYSRMAYEENTTLDQADVVDYYSMYNNNIEFTVGDVIVNKTNYPAGTLVSRVKASEMTNERFTKGGIVFIDNSDHNDLIFTSTGAININKALVVIGQYATPGSKQVEFKLADVIFCNKDIAIRNIQLTAAKGKNVFKIKSGSQSGLNIDECSILGGGNSGSNGVIYDENVNGVFTSIIVHNSTLKLNKDEDLIFFRWSKKANLIALLTSIKLTNNVIYSESSSECHLINCGDKGYNSAASNLDIIVTNNTIYNLHHKYVMIRTTEAKSINISKNVVWFTKTNTWNVFTAIYNSAPEDITGSVTANYLYTNEFAIGYGWSLTGSADKYDVTGNLLGVDAKKDPIAIELNLTNGYIPINRNVVTNGEGADYTTKYWISK